jgi:2-polyprenyl-3-methyl-5-hydroxy-6-metoxy-1,4-benzoquinol methylase
MAGDASGESEQELDAYYRPYLGLGKMDLSQIGSFRAIKSWCKGRTLDVGCGLGYLTAFLSAEGVDANSAAIRYAAQNHPGTVFCQATVSEFIRLGKGPYDSLVCNNLLEHLPDQLLQEFLEGVPKLLSPAGRLIVGYADPYHPAQLVSGLLQRKVLFDSTHENNWSVASLRNLLAGKYRIEEELRTSPFTRFVRLGRFLKGDVLFRCAMKGRSD